MCAVERNFRKNSTASIRERANMVSKRNSLPNQNNLIFQKRKKKERRKKTQKHKYTAAHTQRARRKAGITYSELLKLVGKEEMSYRQTTNTGLLSQRICAVPSAESWELMVSTPKVNISKVH